MHFRSILSLLVFAVISVTAQSTRIELLSRSDDHARRTGGSAVSGAPEFSRDGNFVLFLSDASNLTTNPPGAKPVLNLYRTDRNTGRTTLLSVGADGQPANDAIVNFEMSADNNRVLIETAASNMVANDTNNFVDVFVRDLSSGQNILVTANTNGTVAQMGGYNAVMSADGNIVAFLSADTKLAPRKYTPYPPENNVFVRDVAAGQTVVPPMTDERIQYVHEPSISDDGRSVAFTVELYSDLARDYWSTNLIYDVPTRTSVPMANGIPIRTWFDRGYLWEPIIAPNGKYVTFGMQIGNWQIGDSAFTNLITRYSVDAGETELIVSNNIPYSLRPLAISSDGRTILYSQNRTFSIWREGRETVVFPQVNGAPMQLSGNLANGSMSSDGKFVTFCTDIPLLASDGTASQFRTYVYDVENAVLTECPISSYGGPPSDSVLNGDGSVVLFSAAEPGIEDASERNKQNIYAWNRVTGSVDLVSRSDVSAFENSNRADSKLPENGAISEDGTKVVFASRAPASDLIDTNGTWDVFVLDRSTGRKTLVSVARDGTRSGSHASVNPIISGNGRVVAFFSRATNLVAGSASKGALLFVRELDKSTTHVITNIVVQGYVRPLLRESLNFSYDGNRLAFQTEAISLLKIYSQAFLYDISSNKVWQVSTETAGVEQPLYGGTPVLSRDGAAIAYGSSGGLRLKTIDTGVSRMAPPAPAEFSVISFPQLLQFNREGTKLMYGAPRQYLLSWDLSGTNYAILATNCVEASISGDEGWVAFTRTNSSTKVRQVYLRETATGIEKIISSNKSVPGNTHSKSPRITPDGRFVVFQSRSTNLVEKDFNGTMDIFLYDRERGRLDALSAGQTGGTANGASLRTVVSPDSSYVAFMSFASDIFPHDYNEGSDVFAAHLRGPDTDGDNIDDRWEMAQFGTLDHDMTQDTDGDGLSDAAEFQAQTDPNQAGSSLRVISANVDVGQNIVVRWASIPGRAYRVQARARFDAENAWQDITDAIVSSTNESAFALPPIAGANELYFRIISAD